MARRRRAGWIGAFGVVLAAILVGVTAVSVQHNDESIVVGPSPDPRSSLSIAMSGVADQTQADQVAQTVLDRIEQLNLGDQFPRLGFDPASVAVAATPERLTITAASELLSRLNAAGALWANGDASFVVVESEGGRATNGECRSRAVPLAGIAGAQCYLLGAPTGLDQADIAGASAGINGALLVGWRDGEPTQLITELAARCATRDPACPTSQVALVTDIGVVAVFWPTPATPPATPSLRPARVSSFDAALAIAAMLREPLPPGVALAPPGASESIEVLVALTDIPEGSPWLGCCYIEPAGLPRELVPSAAVFDLAELQGKTAAFDIPAQSVIVEGMFE